MEGETYDLQLAAIRFCKFAVIRENLPIFAVIKKIIAAITPLGDFDMRPRLNIWKCHTGRQFKGGHSKCFKKYSR